jgi:hypothetical protein
MDLQLDADALVGVKDTYASVNGISRQVHQPSQFSFDV